MDIMFAVMNWKFSHTFVAYYKAVWEEPLHLLIHDIWQSGFWLHCVLNTKKSETQK